MNLLAHSPRFSADDAAAMAVRLYGISATASPLPSERDQNFLLARNNGEKLVLKIANALEQRPLLEAQNQVLHHLSSRVSFCPRVVCSLYDRDIETIDIHGRTHLIRVLNHLSGKPLGECDVHTLELMADLGRRLGQLDRALIEFDHPALHRDFHWDLRNAGRVIEQYSVLIIDPDLRRLIRNQLETFKVDVVPALSRVPQSIIHGDANDFNVLVGDGTSDQRIIGLIDFGDMVHSYTIGELAVAIAYAVLNKSEPEAIARKIVDGYAGERTVLDAELQVLWPLAMMRLCMSASLAAYQQQQQPNNHYLGITQAAIKENLARLTKLDVTLS